MSLRIGATPQRLRARPKKPESQTISRTCYAETNPEISWVELGNRGEQNSSDNAAA
jgi:hypothetical protein